MDTVTVFISYSHDTPEHSARVLALATALIALDVDVELDQFVESPEHGWPHWCDERLRPENTKYVLIVCTKTYLDRIRADASLDEGRGVYWEGALINQYIYDKKGNTRFIPVLFGDASGDSVPFPLRRFTWYRLQRFELADKQFEALYRRLTAQPAVVKPSPGARVKLLPWTASQGALLAGKISRIGHYRLSHLIGGGILTIVIVIIFFSWLVDCMGESKRETSEQKEELSKLIEVFGIEKLLSEDESFWRTDNERSKETLKYQACTTNKTCAREDFQKYIYNTIRQHPEQLPLLSKMTDFFTRIIDMANSNAVDYRTACKSQRQNVFDFQGEYAYVIYTFPKQDDGAIQEKMIDFVKKCDKLPSDLVCLNFWASLTSKVVSLISGGR